MACPLFLPTAPTGVFDSGPLPLGESFTGVCSVASELAISEDILHRSCNIGYARGVCERAAGADADAARFLVRSDHAGRIEISWSLERNHHPVAVGSVTFDRRESALLQETEPSVLERQAEAAARSYLRKTGQTAPLFRAA